MWEGIIRTLDDVVEARGWNTDRYSKYALSAIVKNIERRLGRRLPAGVHPTLTSLQRLVLNDSRFWLPDNADDPEALPENLIVQGATSAGKTLISELAILDTLSRQGKALVLVPLKAMVHERAEQFRADIEHCPHDYRVFGSSGDYLDHDESLIKGRYNVGVLVYEKLFSMLNEPDCAILDQCRLIVVDELSMLSKEDRGPKLEVALEIVRALSPQTRILCLATSDCSVAHAAAWLGSPALEDGEEGEPCPVIGSSARPLGLDEYLIRMNGSYRYRHIASEQEAVQLERADALPDGKGSVPPERIHTVVSTEETGEIKVAGYNREERESIQKRKLLLTLLERVFAEQPDAKVLVFVGSRGRTLSTARFIRDNAGSLFTRCELDPQLAEKLAACDADEDRSELSKLLPYGIAFHHAGISTNLRELIEEEFGDHLRLIVATETLTVGVNLPFDVMIMMDYKVPRGKGSPVAVSNQEYRNYIGRAGRLGQSNRPGTSFLMVDEPYWQDYYWDGLMRTERIDSALKGASVQERAPYYLGLIFGTTGAARTSGFTEGDIVRLHTASFAFACGQSDAHAKGIVQALVDSDACLPLPQKKWQKDSYKLTDLGRKLAPYALSIETCQRIVYYFAEGVANEGLPVGASQEDIARDRYLLEMLYHICQHPEVAALSVLRLPSQDQFADAHDARRLVKARLADMLDQTDGDGMPRHLLWHTGDDDDAEGSLAELLGSTSRITDGGEKLQCALRAIVLFYWAQGRTISEIKKVTGFEGITRIVAGDLERIAEVVSYHLEAIHRCLVVAEDDTSQVLVGSALSEFYTLRVRMRYGMTKELAVLASKHVHGLDRVRILNLGAAAAEASLSPVEALFVLPDRVLSRYMTRHQLNELRQRVGKRYAITRVDSMIRVMTDDLGASFTGRQREALKRLGAWDFTDAHAVVELVDDVLAGPAHAVHRLRSRAGAPGLFTWEVTLDGGVTFTEHLFAALAPDADPAALARRLAEAGSPDTLHIAVVPVRDDAEDASSQVALDEFVSAYPGDRSSLLVMDQEFFTLLLASALLMQQSARTRAGADSSAGAAVALAGFLSDAAGVFTAGDHASFSLFNYLPRSQDPASPAPQVCLLANRSDAAYGGDAYSGTDLIDMLGESSDPLAMDFVFWGDAAREPFGSDGRPTIVLLDRSEIERSRSLTRAMHRLRQEEKAGAGRCLMLFDSQRSRERWERAGTAGGPVAELRGAPSDDAGLTWYGQLCEMPWRIAETVEDAAGAVRRFLVSTCRGPQFLVGVSYGHFDPAGPGNTDIEKLRRLVAELEERFGRTRVLFDEHHPEVFYGIDGKGASLAAYRQCRLYVVLDGVWTEQTDNARDELAVIRSRCRAGEADCLVLTPTAARNRGSGTLFTEADGTFSASVDMDPRQFADLAAKKLRLLGAWA